MPCISLQLKPPSIGFFCYTSCPTLSLTSLVCVLLLFPAGIAQSVERQLPKLKVAGSIPVSRSTGRLAQLV